MHLGLLFLVVAGISCAPHNFVQNSANSENFPLGHVDANIASLTALKPRSKKWHLSAPVSVTKISKKSQDEANTHSISEVQESHSVFTDLNGNRQGFKQDHQQVSKNGILQSKLFHQAKQEAKAGAKPHTEELTEIDVPEENIHERIVNNDGIEMVTPVKRNSESSVLSLRSAEELAGYVLETGDEASVVEFLEKLLKAGKISEEEALAFVETIKTYIEEAGKASEDEKIREILLERKIEEEKEAALEQRMEEEEAAKASFFQSMVKNAHTKTDENESILKMNRFLEAALKEGKISESLYNHLKGALVESAMEGLGEEADFLNYGQE